MFSRFLSFLEGKTETNCPVFRWVIIDAGSLEKSYLVVLLLFRVLVISEILQSYSLTVVILRCHFLVFIYITIYILSIYRMIKRDNCHTFFNCKNCKCKGQLIAEKTKPTL